MKKTKKKIKAKSKTPLYARGDTRKMMRTDVSHVIAYSVIILVVVFVGISIKQAIDPGSDILFSIPASK